MLAAQPGSGGEAQQRIVEALIDKLSPDCVNLYGGSHIAFSSGAIHPAEKGSWQVSYRDLRCVGGGASEVGAGYCGANQCRNELWSFTQSGVPTIDKIWQD